MQDDIEVDQAKQDEEKKDLIPEFSEENTDDLDQQIEKMAKSVKVDNINLSEISSSN